MTSPLLNQLLQGLPFSSGELLKIISTAPYRYKVYRIAKKRPGQYRVIAQPSKEVKLLQYWLIDNVFTRLPVHKFATAYRKDSSILDHALLHKDKRFLLKIDFSNFFPSIEFGDLEKHLIQYAKLSPEDARIASRITCWRNNETTKLCLSIGAPSSPLLSNSILYEFDKKIALLARKHGVVYSRYADDLAFSTNKKNVLREVAQEVEIICCGLKYPKLSINEDKTVFTSARLGRFLVGLHLTTEKNVSIGRDRKRRIRKELYFYSKNILDPELVGKLRGELSFAWSVEPEFIRSLVRAVGKKPFDALGLPFANNDREQH